ncbi:hypothetical protein LP420_18495 [Massilia sp. B-10]|nr:hypothetical protein LP420_18495 [Massilia sp. B-10]
MWAAIGANGVFMSPSFCLRKAKVASVESMTVPFFFSLAMKFLTTGALKSRLATRSVEAG